MNSGYKISLFIAFVLAILMVWVMSSSASIVQSALGAIFMGSVFFLVLGFGLSGVYYCFTQRRAPYPGLLMAATLLTAFLFFMDYTVWDPTPTPIASQVFVESLFIGPIYVSLFFGVFSGVYLLGERISRMFGRTVRG